MILFPTLIQLIYVKVDSHPFVAPG